jgi:hypothetical protein
MEVTVKFTVGKYYTGVFRRIEGKRVKLRRTGRKG